ncbi:MAG: aminopeptidase P N-terminal domain-containing protein [Deltaproteobacteria bacterium]|nr:aminopeptidase P N-terminal domain-containing protein [Deltaproteobacteria bacterium]
MDFSFFDASACAERRARLAARLGNLPALIAAGAPRPRGTHRGHYPFRAASHFLYLFGLHLPKAMGLWSGERWQLYLPEPAADAALWTGPVPDFAALSEMFGVAVLPMPRLAETLARKTTSTLPAPEFETCLEQSNLLGREIRPGVLPAADEPLADALIAMRLVHDAAGIAGLREAADATVAAHLAGLRATRPKIRESEVRAALEAELCRRNMTVSYTSIVSVRGEILHNEDHHHMLADGDLLLIDAGAETRGGWAGDVTRTWPVSGRFSPTQRDLYDVVLLAQAAAVAAVRPGLRYLDLQGIASHAIAKGLIGLGLLGGDPAELVADGVVALFFPHGVGHLIGLDVHDLDDLGDRAAYAPGRTRSTSPGFRALRLDRDLVPNMAVTIEPGFYQVPAILDDPERTRAARDRLRRERLAAFHDVRGIRIEDTILVTANGHEDLTSALPKQAPAVENAMRAS